MHRGTVQADGPKVRRLRLEKELTQEELASRAGCDKKTIENIEAGKPCRPVTLGAVAGQLGKQLQDLVVWKSPHEKMSGEGATPRSSPGSAPAPPSLLVGRERDIRNLKGRFSRASTDHVEICPLQIVTSVRG